MISLLSVPTGGVSAAMTAKKHDLKFMLLEQYSIDKPISDHPGDKVAGTVILDLPLAGKLTLKDSSGNQLMEMWQNLILKFRIPVQETCRVLLIDTLNGYFKILASENQNFRSKFVLLTTGRSKVHQLIKIIKTQNIPEASEAGKRSIYAELVV